MKVETNTLNMLAKRKDNVDGIRHRQREELEAMIKNLGEVGAEQVLLDVFCRIGSL